MWAKINLARSLSFFPPSIVACQDCSESQLHSGETFLHIWRTDNGAPSPFTWPDMIGKLCHSLFFFLSHIHTHNHIHEMHPFIQVDSIRGGSQGKLIKLKAGPAICGWAAETQTSQHLLITCLYYLQHCLHIVWFCLSRDYCLSFMHNWLGVKD